MKWFRRAPAQPKDQNREVDCRIADGEARNAEAPRSFFIPPRSERASLQPGDYAKLLFEVDDPQQDDPGAERSRCVMPSPLT
jgi:hypothetical protein